MVLKKTTTVVLFRKKFMLFLKLGVENRCTYELRVPIPWISDNQDSGVQLGLYYLERNKNPSNDVSFVVLKNNQDIIYVMLIHK